MCEDDFYWYLRNNSHNKVWLVHIIWTSLIRVTLTSASIVRLALHRTLRLQVKFRRVHREVARPKITYKVSASEATRRTLLFHGPCRWLRTMCKHKNQKLFEIKFVDTTNICISYFIPKYASFTMFFLCMWLQLLYFL